MEVGLPVTVAARVPSSSPTGEKGGMWWMIHVDRLLSMRIDS